MTMEFPKRIFVTIDGGAFDEPEQIVATEKFEGLPDLKDGAEVAIYGLLRVKKVQVTRKLVAANGEAEEAPEPMEPNPEIAKQFVAGDAAAFDPGRLGQ
jgi:hypothetical protein